MVYRGGSFNEQPTGCLPDIEVSRCGGTLDSHVSEPCLEWSRPKPFFGRLFFVRHRRAEIEPELSSKLLGSIHWQQICTSAAGPMRRLGGPTHPNTTDGLGKPHSYRKTRRKLAVKLVAEPFPQS